MLKIFLYTNASVICFVFLYIIVKDMINSGQDTPFYIAGFLVLNLGILLGSVAYKKIRDSLNEK